MAKTVVYESPYQKHVVAVEVGIEFESGVPQTIPDEAAEKLLARYDNKFLDEEGWGPKVPNPNFGQQKHPYFRLVQAAPSAPASSEPSK